MEVLYSLRLQASTKALSSFPNLTTSSLEAQDSDLGTVIEWNMLAEHIGEYAHIFHHKA